VAQTEIKLELDPRDEAKVPDPQAVSREARIATIHALANWLTDNPSTPVPTSIVASYHVNDQDEPDEPTRVAGVLDVSKVHGIEMTEGEHTVQGDLYLFNSRANGITIIYRVAAHKDTRPVRRYVP
jgi:hypothetical protein